jgi:hypothetical protein
MAIHVLFQFMGRWAGKIRNKRSTNSTYEKFCVFSPATCFDLQVGYSQAHINWKYGKKNNIKENYNYSWLEFYKNELWERQYKNKIQ